MVFVYLDVETYSPHDEPRFGDKIIAIGYEEVGGKLEVLKGWESSEKTILSEFYNYLREKLSYEKVRIIGFNVLMFDIIALATRLYRNSVDELENIFQNFKRIYWEDLLRCLYPLNKFSFKGLSAEEIAGKLKIEASKYSNKEICKFYDEHEYGKIVEHLKSDIKFLKDLSYWLKQRTEDVRRILEEKKTKQRL